MKRITKEQKELASKCHTLLLDYLSIDEGFGSVIVDSNFRPDTMYYSNTVNEVLGTAPFKNQYKAIVKPKFSEKFIKHYDIKSETEYFFYFLKDWIGINDVEIKIDDFQTHTYEITDGMYIPIRILEDDLHEKFPSNGNYGHYDSGVRVCMFNRIIMRTGSIEKAFAFLEAKRND